MLPKTGKKLHLDEEDVTFAMMIAEALDMDLGRTHQGVKTAMRWTGASERSVKHWFAGSHAPHGQHLVALMRNSNPVLTRILIAAGRRDLLLALEVTALRARLEAMLALLDQFSIDGMRNPARREA
ncbi:MAG: hypothetical protein WCZ66_12010 [Sphingomonadaceae bacterium]